MDTFGTIVPYLFLATFALALGIGAWQYFRVVKARREHRRSASAVARHEPPVSGAAASGGTGPGSGA